MQDVLNKLSEANEEIQKIDQKSREVLADVLTRETRVFKREKEADEKDALLSERESAVSKIESVVALKKYADEKMIQAQALMENAVNAQKELDQNVKLETAKLSDLRDVSRREQENVDKQKKELEVEISKRVEQCLINMGLRKG